MILQDQVALVTGGASGIGRATALAYPYGEASYAERLVRVSVSVRAASPTGEGEEKLNEVIALL